MRATSGYSWIQIGLHWVIAILIGMQFINHEGMEKAWRALQKGQPFDGSAAQVHVLIGLTILLLVVVRIVVRLTRGAPELPADGNPFLDKVAMATHLLLYGLMLAVPLMGIAAWFLGIGIAAGMHGALFAAMLGLIVLHTIAALYHQFILKDGLIRRMTRSK
jgi:cytochrome b561